MLSSIDIGIVEIDMDEKCGGIWQIEKPTRRAVDAIRSRKV
jgi:hypothetical protein